MAARRGERILHHCHEQEEEHPGLGPELAETPGVGVQGIVLDSHQQGSDDTKRHQSEQRKHLAVLLQCPATHGPGVPKSQRLQTGVPATEVLQNRASPASGCLRAPKTEATTRPLTKPAWQSGQLAGATAAKAKPATKPTQLIKKIWAGGGFHLLSLRVAPANWYYTVQKTWTKLPKPNNFNL